MPRLNWKAVGDAPFVAHEKLGDVRARLQHLFLNVDGEGVYLSQQERLDAVARARRIEREHTGGIGRIQHVQRFAANVGAEFNSVAAADHGESVEVFGDGGGEVAVGSGGGTDLLEPGDQESGQHRSE